MRKYKVHVCLELGKTNNKTKTGHSMYLINEQPEVRGVSLFVGRGQFIQEMYSGNKCM